MGKSQCPNQKIQYYGLEEWKYKCSLKIVLIPHERQNSSLGINLFPQLGQ